MSLAVAYYRVSTAKQADDERHGLQRQRDLCQAYAAEHGFDLVREYAEAFTGTDMAGRPRLAEMLALLETRDDINTVLVECSDRLARELAVSEMIYAEMRARGVEVITVDTGIAFGNDTSPSRVMIRQVLGAVAEFNKSQLVARLAVARMAKTAAGGKGVGRNRYGVKPEEAEILGMAHTLAREGKSRAMIASLLNGNGFRTSRGTEWSSRSVSRLLSRPRPVRAPIPEAL